MATATKKIPAKKKAIAPVKAARAARPAAAPAKKPRTAPVARPAPAAVTDKADKSVKAKKPKLVRDSYTIPKSEYAVLEQLKLRAARLGHPAKKSEVLRAGLKVLAALDDARFLAGVVAVPAMKTGRPAKV